MDLRNRKLLGPLIGACLSAAAGRALALDWSNIWTTPDQKAQGLLDSGHPLEAARLFSDSRRRAYAELQARHYADAARELKPFHDVDSEYNRGNALAREGDLRSALASYDAALEQAPDARDVRHNRDLIARALEQRSGQQSASGTPQQGGAGREDQNQNSQKGGSQSSSGQEKGGNRPGSPLGPQTGGSSTGSANAGDETEQARRDAALAAELQRKGNRENRSASGKAGTARGNQSGADLAGRPDASARGQAFTDEWPPPKSEQTLALEQWLRRIPEDPGGLLRRKFLIEHIERHQGTDPDP
jgi:Ca-activated chloride channel homolog